MKTLTHPMIWLPLAVVLAACSSPAYTTSPTTSAAPMTPLTPTATARATPTATPSSTPTSVSGGVPKRLEDEARIVTPAGATLARLKVNSIKVDPKCPSTNKEPERGHRIVIDMSAEVLVIGEGDDAVPYLNTATWKVIGPDGTVENATPIDWECYPAADQIDGQIDTQGKHAGVVVLDSKYAEGHVVLMEDFLGSSAGWEWEFPAS